MANQKVQAVPKLAEAVELFYLGGFVETVTNRKGEIVPLRPIVTAYGQSFVVPKKGESLTLPRYIARRLEMRNRNPQGQSVFTMNRNLAKLVKEGKQMSAPMGVAPLELTREELLARLAEMDAVEKTPTKKVAKKEDGE